MNYYPRNPKIRLTEKPILLIFNRSYKFCRKTLSNSILTNPPLNPSGGWDERRLQETTHMRAPDDSHINLEPLNPIQIQDAVNF